jgi:hypothetical protein
MEERVKPIPNSLGFSKERKRLHNEEKVIKGARHLEEPTMRIVKISTRGESRFLPICGSDSGSGRVCVLTGKRMGTDSC